MLVLRGAAVHASAARAHLIQVRIVRTLHLLLLHLLLLSLWRRNSLLLECIVSERKFATSLLSSTLQRVSPTHI